LSVSKNFMIVWKKPILVLVWALYRVVNAFDFSSDF
jgi:hypothetical protein